MNFELNEDQRLLRDTIRSFLEAEVAPHVEKFEKAEELPREILKRLWSELGLGGMVIPEEYGGIGLDAVAYCLVVEELARVWAALSITVAVHNSVGAGPIVEFGNEAQKKKYLPKLATEWIGAFSLSEPVSGSDAAALRATAVKDGAHYVLNGEKNWVTTGGFADTYIVMARTANDKQKGISAFIVEKGTTGLTLTRTEDKMGLKASETRSLVFQDCRIPAENLLAGEGMGLKIALTLLNSGRFGVAAQAVGISRAALEASLKYARERETFGKPIGQHQAVGFMLADMHTKLEASRALTYRAAWLKTAGLPFAREASMAKLFATEASTWITHKAIQIHGGYGYVRDYPVERYYRDARVTEIYEGTSEIQRLVIASSLLKEAVA
ncbi:MAG: acyl-CoA dehydrogenase family protein [Candidatus Eisenbacteria bacterium]|nr:acyl-CoA dehydrogenase family protein [Candidatus Eisenbacteria bacterium]